jgi:hypothetical protein
MFEDILQATRESGQFRNDEVKKSGQQRYPLATKMMSCLGRWALEISVSALEDMFGITDIVMSNFVEKWECWFIDKYHSERVKMLRREDWVKLEASYSRCEIVWCVSGMGMVYVKYDTCPWGQRIIHCKKEG